MIEQQQALRKARDLEDLAGILERDGEHVLAGAIRKTARLIRALWSDAE